MQYHIYSMWSGGDEASDLDCARGCFRHFESVFTELADFRAFELLRNHKTRANYLLLKQVREWRKGQRHYFEEAVNVDLIN